MQASHMKVIKHFSKQQLHQTTTAAKQSSSSSSSRHHHRHQETKYELTGISCFFQNVSLFKPSVIHLFTANTAAISL